MKKLFVIPLMILLVLLWVAPVLASDPPDVDVDIGVSTPGDVDLDVGINAGGDVDVTVDGVDFKQTAATAQEAYDRAFAPRYAMRDYTYYWNITGIGPRIEGQIADLQEVSALLANAESRLIQGHELTTQDIEGISQSLGQVEAEARGTSVDVATMATTISDMQSLQDKTWNQLMYGAEAHISILDDELANQKAESEAKYQLLSSKLEIADANYAELLNYTDYLQRQYLYYFWILGGVAVALVAGLVWAIIRSGRKI